VQIRYVKQVQTTTKTDCVISLYFLTTAPHKCNFESTVGFSLFNSNQQYQFNTINIFIVKFDMLSLTAAQNEDTLCATTNRQHVAMLNTMSLRYAEERHTADSDKAST